MELIDSLTYYSIIHYNCSKLWWDVWSQWVWEKLLVILVTTIRIIKFAIHFNITYSLVQPKDSCIQCLKISMFYFTNPLFLSSVPVGYMFYGKIDFFLSHAGLSGVWFKLYFTCFRFSAAILIHLILYKHTIMQYFKLILGR